jgi:hypothetical protein
MPPSCRVEDARGAQSSHAGSACTAKEPEKKNGKKQMRENDLGGTMTMNAGDDGKMHRGSVMSGCKDDTKARSQHRMMYTGVTAGLFKFKYRGGQSDSDGSEIDVTKSMQLVERAEAKTKKFFIYIADLIQKIKGIDLTVRGYSVLGHGLQMMALESDDDDDDAGNGRSGKRSEGADGECSEDDSSSDSSYQSESEDEDTDEELEEEGDAEEIASNSCSDENSSSSDDEDDDSCSSSSASSSGSSSSSSSDDSGTESGSECESENEQEPPRKKIKK